MTPRRRAALRKAQLASARKRHLRARTNSNSRVRNRRVQAVRSHVVRNKRRYIAAGAVLGAGVGAAVAYDHHKNVRLYHNTDKRNVAGIKKHGLHGVKEGSFSHRHFNEKPGMVFVSKGRNKTKMFGNRVVKIKMNRKEFKRHATRDGNMAGMTSRAYQIHERHLAGKKIRVRRGSPLQNRQYKQMFPDGTKESFGTQPLSGRKLKRQQKKEARSIDKAFNKGKKKMAKKRNPSKPRKVANKIRRTKNEVKYRTRNVNRKRTAKRMRARTAPVKRARKTSARRKR